MRNTVIVWTTIVVAGVIFGCLALYFVGPARQLGLSDVTSKEPSPDVTVKPKSSDAKLKAAPADMTFEDEPEARALYEKMIETMRNAESLSYTSNCRLEGRARRRCTYTIWMKKPNYFCLEAVTGNGQKGGTLVGDGDYLWIHWPKDRPFFASEDRENYERSRSNVYMKKATPIGRHSIGHEVGQLGVGLMTVIDPSVFHGSTDTLVPYIDWVRGMGKEKVGDEECDVIEVSFMKHQRSWYLWLSRQDHLPRKLKQVVRAAYDIIVHELWSQVTINAEIPTEKFAWAPPEGWQQWSLPDDEEENLIKPGQEAPDFELLSADGKSIIKLSDYRDKIVWFYIWKAG